MSSNLNMRSNGLDQPASACSLRQSTVAACSKRPPVRIHQRPGFATQTMPVYTRASTSLLQLLRLTTGRSPYTQWHWF